MADLNEALALNPKYPRGYSHRAAIYELHGDLDQAMADANEAMRPDPEDALAYNWRGRAYFGKKQYDLAMSDREQALRLDPLLSEARQNPCPRTRGRRPLTGTVSTARSHRPLGEALA
jgi:tetratricopeptide (TPR) repeat protein